MISPSRKMKLIVNPNSQPLKVALFLQPIISKFTKAGFTVDLYKAKGGGDATMVARESAKSGNYELVVAAGGDGTVNEVLNGLMSHPVKIGGASGRERV